MLRDKAKNNPKYLGLKKVSQEEMDQITERLQRPTKMATIRERQPQNAAPMPEVS